MFGAPGIDGVPDGPMSKLNLFTVLGVMGGSGARNWQHSLILPKTCLPQGSAKANTEVRNLQDLNKGSACQASPGLWR